MTIHVLPVNDLFPHIEEGTNCPCRPRIERHGNDLLVIHNAWDGREQWEEARSVLTSGRGGRA
jgi:hypothetical protein